MTESKLTADQAVDLVRKLATDDAFRQLFQTDAEAALQQVGAGSQAASLLMGRDEKCSCQLADKAVFAGVLAEMENEKFHAAMAMDVPRLRFR